MTLAWATSQELGALAADTVLKRDTLLGEKVAVKSKPLDFSLEMCYNYNINKL